MSKNNFLNSPITNDLSTSFYEKIINLLSDNGKAMLVMPISSGSSNETKEIRKHILERDLMEESYTLPSNVFLNTSISTCMYVFNKNKDEDCKGKIYFVNGGDESFVIKGKRVGKYNKDIFDYEKLLSLIYKKTKIES
jgi:type I restriction-modification system DNA methylase subunit